MIAQTTTAQTLFEALNMGNENLFRSPKLGTPTTAWPGTEEKVAVLRERLERGENLWHPQDPTVLPRIDSRRAPA